MKSKNNKRESIVLTLNQWISLHSIAIEQGALAAPGKRTGLPSWRTLIRMIAEGEVILSKKEQTNERKT